MAVNKQVLLRYKVLNECLRNEYRSYNIDDLVQECNKALRNTYGVIVSKRTIQSDINNLQNAPYYIELEESLYSGHKRIYRYKDTSYSLPLIDITDEALHTIRETIEILDDYQGYPQYDWVRLCLKQIEQGNVLDADSQYVSFQNNPDMKGLGYFQFLLGAIINKQPLYISYISFKQKELKGIIHPYYLKQYNNRWFLLAYTEGVEKITTYALDRIMFLKHSSAPYKKTEINFEQYYEDVVGASVHEDADIENVVLRVNARRFPYIETKPLHQSQTIIKELSDEKYKTIRIQVIINKELEAEVLSLGNDAEIIEPEWFRVSFKEKISDMYKTYQNDEENLHS